MPFVKGVTSNPAGRKKGIIDKRQVYKTVREQLDAAGFNPVENMIKIARDESHPVQTRRQATKDLLDKAYPDLKAIDITSQDSIKDDMKKLKNEMIALVAEHVKEY